MKKSGDIVKETYQRMMSVKGFIAYIKELQRDEKRLEAIASKSYTHNSGFTKIPLEKSEDGTSIRFHIWPVMSKEEPLHVHFHPWNLNSKIIHGKILTEIFQEDSEQFDVPTKKFLCTKTNSRQGDKIEYQGMTGLKKVITYESSSGDNYFLDAHMLHRATNTYDGKSYTLILRNPTLLDSVLIFEHDDYEFEKEDFEYPHLTVEELHSELNELLGLLKP